MNFRLPNRPVPDRVSLNTQARSGDPLTCASLDGPGCIRHIWLVWGRGERVNRQATLRIYFDDDTVPHVEAPLGDFFGVMHGKAWYPVNTPYLSIKEENGYNCYFAMPFARQARIELESCCDNSFYIQVDWHRYPGQTMEEPMRFCARWRREFPTESYGENFLMLDADGPGRLLGFVYGVRLDDNVDRWSHGGAENLYIDGEEDHPAYLRGIGGEDTFGTSFGGALHTPETHLYSGMPYYTHEDVGEARPAQRLVGYRFFEPDPIPFRRSLQMRFGCMRNDICATTYWYQEGAVRPFCRLPSWEQIACLDPGHRFREHRTLPRGSCDLPLPESGNWWLCGPFGNAGNKAMSETLPPEAAFTLDAEHDGRHEENSPWMNEASREGGVDKALWLRRPAHHGFLDFNHYFRPRLQGVAAMHPGVAVARCVLNTPAEMTATLRVSWDDDLLLRVNDQCHNLGVHAAFRSQTLSVPLRAGANDIVLKLSNTRGSNHGGWAFAFRATAPDGTVLIPQAR